jgi:Asp-tRNA(Asn)/Glu-tRNA(Gln) amidotransferase A subunit family amidase
MRAFVFAALQVASCTRNPHTQSSFSNDEASFLHHQSLRRIDLLQNDSRASVRRPDDGLLNVMITTTPKDLLLSIARERDQERIQGNIRGPLHGIPISVKVAPSLPGLLDRTPDSLS